MTSVSITRGNSPSATYVAVGRVTYLFSYETCVAFRFNGKWTASENIWSQTTGKHIDAVASSARRIPHVEFQAALRRVSERLLEVTA